MDFALLSWVFALAVTLHNIEEAILLPAWSQTAGRWQHPVGAREFRFAVIVLTAAAYGAAFLATVGGRESAGAYIVAGYALAMLLNVVFPHLLATLFLRRYAPGTGTALLLNLPITVLLLREAIAEGYIQVRVFAWAGPLVVVVILGSIPVLFATGKRLQGERTG